MAIPVSSRSYFQGLTQISTKHSLTYAIVGLFSFALIRICAYRRSFVKADETLQSSFRKIYLTFKENVVGLSNLEVHELLTLITAQAPEQSDQPFDLGVGQYIAYMPPEYRWIYGVQEGFPQSLKPFQEQVIEPSQAKVAINLIYKEGYKEDYLYGCSSEELKTPGFNYGAEYTFTQANSPISKTYLQLADSPVGAWINLAGYVVKTCPNNVPIFIHCRDGLAETAEFIGYVEYMRHYSQLRTPSSQACRQKMIEILKALAKTAKGRVPKLSSMSHLMNPPQY